ncbi:MAG: hypothetical protein JNG84_13515 [Archangium sp.]|nr:hypothetical protein [Archangium sp.]
MVRAAVLVAGVVVASSCGGSICDQSVAAWSRLAAKRGQCNVTIFTGSTATCENKFASGSCKAADERVVSRFIECIDRISSCAVGLEQQWTSQVNGCLVAAVPATPTCTF